MTRAELTGSPTSAPPTGDALERAARWVGEVRGAPNHAARLRAVTASADGRRALVALLRSLPVVPADFSHDPAGEELRNWFHPARRFPVDRAPVAVQPLPATAAEYFRGRPRQALRTNLSRAAAAGLTCDHAPSADELWRAGQAIATRRRQRLDDIVLRRPRPGLVRNFTLAYDAAGDPVGLTETVVDGPWAGLAVLLSAPDHGDAQLIRYLLHGETVKELIAAGVRTVVVGGSMLLTSPGTRYFQQRTGFVPAWLRPTPSVAPGRGRRRPYVAAPLTLDDLTASLRTPLPAAPLVTA